MSWSLSIIGTRDNVLKALAAESERLSGQSKLEFDEALPHLSALVAMNVNTGVPDALVELDANGHAGMAGVDLKRYSTLNVNRLGSCSKRLVQ